MMNHKYVQTCLHPPMFIRLVLDIVAFIVLLSLPLIHDTTKQFHKVGGYFLLFFFIYHLAINYKWIQTLTKGTYTISRIASLFTFLGIIGTIIAVFLTSLHIFPIKISPIELKLVHATLGYWFFLFVTMHLGLHGTMLGCCAKEKIPFLRSIPHLSVITYAALAMVAFSGINAIYEAEFIRHLFLVPSPDIALQFVGQGVGKTAGIHPRVDYNKLFTDCITYIKIAVLIAFPTYILLGKK